MGALVHVPPVVGVKIFFYDQLIWICYYILAMTL